MSILLWTIFKGLEMQQSMKNINIFMYSSVRV